MTTKHDVIAYHRAHPEADSAEIGRALGCHSAYVRATAGRNGITLPKGYGRCGGRPVGPNSGCGFNLRVGDDVAAALSMHAETRGVTTSELCRRILSIAAEDSFVDAILDDADEAAA